MLKTENENREIELAKREQMHSEYASVDTQSIFNAYNKKLLVKEKIIECC